MTDSDLQAIYHAIPETGLPYSDLAAMVHPTLPHVRLRSYGEALACRLDSAGLLTSEQDGRVYRWKIVDKVVYRFIRFGEDFLDTDKLRWPGRDQ